MLQLHIKNYSGISGSLYVNILVSYINNVGMCYEKDIKYIYFTYLYLTLYITCITLNMYVQIYQYTFYALNDVCVVTSKF